MEEQISVLTFSKTNSESPFSDFKAGHYSIRTTEYQSLINWYKEKLDFRLIKEWSSGEMQLAFMALSNDNSFLVEILGVKNVEKNTDSENKAGYDHICFNVMNLDLTIEELNKREINILRSFKAPAIGKKVAFILDPFGNKIEFCEDIK